MDAIHRLSDDVTGLLPAIFEVHNSGMWLIMFVNVQLVDMSDTLLEI